MPLNPPPIQTWPSRKLGSVSTPPQIRQREEFYIYPMPRCGGWKVGDVLLGANIGLLLGTILHLGALATLRGSKHLQYAIAARHSGSMDGRPNAGPQTWSSNIAQAKGRSGSGLPQYICNFCLVFVSRKVDSTGLGWAGRLLLLFPPPDIYLTHTCNGAGTGET